jgi:type II secretory pathway predicted ATPase ExeA
MTVGTLTRPGSNQADFYREMGDLFGVELRPHNRWGGFKLLRERWIAHLEGTLFRPVLLIDEAQEMQPSVLNELRLLSSLKFDSRILLTVVFAGDAHFTAKLRRDDLLPLGSRIRTRLTLETANRDELPTCLKHLQTQAGNPGLMTPELMKTLCDHALGNYRVLTTMASELLTATAQQELPQLDEKLFLNVFAATPSAPAKRVGSTLTIQ